MSTVTVTVVEVKIRYLSRDIAEHFGSHKELREVIHLSDNAKYEHLLNLLGEKYEKAIKLEHGKELKGGMLDAFIFICEGTPLRRIRDKSVNQDNEVLVAYADFGG